jgi:hypothetical protein
MTPRIRILLIFLVLLTGLRLLLASQTELTPDEAYYYLWARHPGVVAAFTRLLVQRKRQEAGLLVAALDLQEHDPLAPLARFANARAHVLDS